jgi:3-mercaptopyruvate sulfurtransferase SseA
VARRHEIPKDGLVAVYCNSGSLSARAVFAQRLLGWDNVKVLQDGFEGLKAKGGFEANKRASRPAGSPMQHPMTGRQEMMPVPRQDRHETRHGSACLAGPIGCPGSA